MSTLSNIKTNTDNYKFDEIGCFEKPFGIVLESYEERYSNAFYMFLKFYQSYNTNKYEFRSLINFYSRMQIDVDIVNEIFNIECEIISNKDNIHEFIQNKLMLDIPVLVPGNLKECYYAQQHKVEDQAHLFVIKGFDKAKHKYLIVDSTHMSGEGNKYDDFFMEEDTLELLYNSCCKDMDINDMYCFKPQSSENAVGIDDIVIKCITLYENNLTKQPYKEIDYINILMDFIQNNDDINSNISIEKQGMKKDYSINSFLMEMKNTVKFKNVFLSELITNLSLYLSDNDFLNKLMENKTIIIEKWNKIIDISIGNLYRSKLVNVSKELDDVIEEEKNLRSLISEAKSMLVSLNKNYDDMNKVNKSNDFLINKKVLPKLEVDIKARGEYIAARNEIDEKIAKVWSEVLGVEKIGIDDNFFALGGHSLKAIQVIARIHKELNVELYVSELFNTPTIRQIGEYIKNSKESIYTSIEPVEEKEVYEVSSAQKRLYALNQFGKEEINYNIPLVMIIEGKLDKERVEETFKKLVERHDAFRTSFEMVDENIVQRIHKETVLDVEYCEIEEKKEIIDKEIQSFIRPFDLSKAPLLRVKLAKVSEEKHLLMFDIHHIISDGVSMSIIIKEFSKLYKGEEIEKPRLQYKDYAVWQNKLLNSEIMKNQEEYWLDVFNEEVPVLDIPTDYIRPTMQSFEGESIWFKADSELAEKIKKISRANGTTMYMTLLATYNILLSKYSGQEDIVVGSPTAGRPHTQLQDIVGMFVNTLAMRNYPKGEKTFKEFLHDVKKNALSAYENQDYQFDELIEKLDIRKDLSRNPLFNTMFVLQNIDMEEIDIEDIILKPYKFGIDISKFDIALTAVETENEIGFNLEYCTKLFKGETIERLRDHFVNILKEVAENPEKKISKIDILSEEEKRKILVEFNDTKTEYPKDKTIYELFEEQVKKTPDNIAVVYENKELSYRELNKRANQLARVLREKGVGPDKIVGIMVERSLEMIIGIMGILKAGGAYLPIDPNYPTERIEYTIKDSKAKVLLTQKNLIKNINFDGEIIDLEDEKINFLESCNLKKLNNPEDLAYVIYTSGTTGKPKGVMIEHKNVVRLLFNKRMQFDFNEKDVWTMFHSYCFDFSVWEMYGALLYGGKLILISRENAIDTEAYLKILKEEKVTVLNQIPTPFYNLMNKEIKYKTKELNLRYIIFGGEALKPKMLKKWCEKYPKTKLINMYGITETTVHVTYKEISEFEIDKGISNIGKPIPTLKTYIMDKNSKLLPIGVPGELCVSGEGLGRGYLNRPELTEEKFIRNPYELVERIYKSGDLARWLPDGNIEYLGRIDHQVKIRGFRIELGEIESQLLKYEEIKEVVVIDREDKESNKYLCAYVVSNKEITVTELRGHLSKELPDYMVPAYFIQLEKIPLTPTGKIDRKALPEPDGDINTGIEYVAPRNEIEEKIVKVWSQILNVDKIGIDDNFFALGGHSLNTFELSSKLNVLNIPLKVSEVHEYSTIRKISDFIRQKYPHIGIEEAAIDIVDNLTISNNSNIIIGITSNDDKYSWQELNCFYRPIAVIFKYFKKEYFDLLLINVSFYSSFMADGQFENILECGPENSFIEFYKQVLQEKFKIKINKIEYSTSDEMHEKIRESIDNDSPVLMPQDLYGLFYYSMYKKMHHAHYTIIKGYDAQKQIYNILDNMHIDNGSGTIYKDFSTKFEEIYEMNKLYMKTFQNESVKPYFWAISNERVNEEYYDIYECILEHCNYLDQVNSDNSKIKYLECELINIIEQGRLENDSDEQIKNLLQVIIPMINFKSVYYDLIFKFLEKLNGSPKAILELKDIQSNIKVNWNDIRIKMLDNVAQRNYDFKEIKDFITRNLEEERTYRQKFIEIVAELKYMKNQKERSNNYEFSEYNNKNAQILVGNKEIKFNLDSDKTYDIWITEDNAPQMLRDVAYNDQFTIEGKLHLDHDIEETLFHDGIIVKFINGVSILFGVLKDFQLGDKLVIYCPQKDDNYAIFEKPYKNKKDIYLKVSKNNSKYSFYYREKTNDEWKNIKCIDIKESIKNVGFFSKKWQFGKHSSSISEICYVKTKM